VAEISSDLIISVGLVVAILFGVVDIEHLGSAGKLAMFVLVVLLVLGYVGLTAVNPNEARALVLFGHYDGSLKQQGFWWVTRSPGARACRSRSATSRVRSSRSTTMTATRSRSTTTSSS
jgi:hypothetical protein